MCGTLVAEMNAVLLLLQFFLLASVVAKLQDVENPSTVTSANKGSSSSHNRKLVVGSHWVGSRVQQCEGQHLHDPFELPVVSAPAITSLLKVKQN